MGLFVLNTPSRGKVSCPLTQSSLLCKRVRVCRSSTVPTLNLGQGRQDFVYEKILLINGISSRSFSSPHSMSLRVVSLSVCLLLVLSVFTFCSQLSRTPGPGRLRTSSRSPSSTPAPAGLWPSGLDLGSWYEPDSVPPFREWSSMTTPFDRTPLVPDGPLSWRPSLPVLDGSSG